jgi:hypothetical protein
MASVSCNFMLATWPGEAHSQMSIELTKENALQIPCISNPKKVEAHTKLIVLDDMNLLKIIKKEKEAKGSK